MHRQVLQFNSIVDTFHQSLLTYAMWHYLIDCYFTPIQLLVVHWSFEVYLMLSVRQ
jgi:hypothetical protein